MQRKSDKENFQWAQRTAYRSRHPMWWCNLGAFYATGTGCTANLERARKWYAKAARVKNSRGMFELGCMFLDGEGGRKNFRRAEELLTASAKAGDLDAAKLLEYGYSHGARDFTPSRKQANYYRSLCNKIRKSYSEQLAARALGNTKTR